MGHDSMKNAANKGFHPTAHNIHRVRNMTLADDMNTTYKRLSVLMACLLISFTSQAKHICPVITPIEINNVRYLTPNDQGFRGYIQAQDMASGKILWERTLYRVIWRLPFPEPDFYYCVITEMKLHNGRLYIQNDRRKWYELDLTTRKVRRSAPPKEQ